MRVFRKYLLAFSSVFCYNLIIKGGENLGGNYEKGMFNQLQEALKKIDALNAKVDRIEAETTNKYLKIIYEKEQEIARLKLENAQLKGRIAKLEAEVERLRKQLNNDSSNSSSPPSSDQKPNRPNTFNNREKSGKKSGGQNGHKGHHLSKAEIKQKIKDGTVKHKIVEHGESEKNRRYVSKYIVDINIEAIAAEHRFYENEDGRFDIPKEFHCDVQYGNELKTLTTMLISQGIVASNRAAEFICEMSANLIQLSEGSIYNWLAEFDRKVKPVIENIKTKVLNSPVMGIDETGSRCEGKNMYFRNYSDKNNVLYTFNPTKGKTAIEEDGVLPVYIGTLVHDHNTVNYNYGSLNAECNVHVIRYLKANFENTQNIWSVDMIDFLSTLNNTKKLAIVFGASGFEQEDMYRYRQRYDEILSAGFEALNNTKSRIYKVDEKRLLNRLRKYRENHLLFAMDFNVPFDNNLSERDLRLVKTKTKVSGCFRSLQGGRRYAALMSVIKTAIKQNLSPYAAVRSIFASALGAVV